MVVHFIVFARDAGPVDRAVLANMLLDDVQLGVDLRRDQEHVRSFAADHHVVRNEGLVFPALQLLALCVHLAVRVAARRLANRQLPDALLARVRAGDQQVVAGAAGNQVRPAPAIDDVVAIAAFDAVIAIAAVNLVIAAGAVDRVVAAQPFNDVAGILAGDIVCAIQDMLTQEMAGVIVVYGHKLRVRRRVLEIADGLVQRAVVNRQAVDQQGQRHGAAAVEIGHVDLVETAVKRCDAGGFIRAAPARKRAEIDAAKFQRETVIRDDGNLVRAWRNVDVPCQRQTGRAHLKPAIAYDAGGVLRQKLCDGGVAVARAVSQFGRDEGRIGRIGGDDLVQAINRPDPVAGRIGRARQARAGRWHARDRSAGNGGRQCGGSIDIRDIEIRAQVLHGTTFPSHNSTSGPGDAPTAGQPLNTRKDQRAP